MTVFIAGSRNITYIPDKAKQRLINIMRNQYNIIIGDADGADRLVQEFCHQNHYRNITIYASNGKARNNVGGYNIYNVYVPPYISGYEFFASKDNQMAVAADYGYMLWDGKSRGTYNNIKNLANQNKAVLVYIFPQDRFLTIKSPEDIYLLKI